MLKKLDRLSLTAKVAVFMIAVNLFGIAILASYTLTTEIRISVAKAIEKWSLDTEQFASLSAGGVKWGKADVVEEAYQLFRDDASLNLVQFAAFKPDGTAVDMWSRQGAETILAEDEFSAIRQAAGSDPALASEARDGIATIFAPLPKNSVGKETGYVVTVWTTGPIHDAAARGAVMIFAIQAVVVLVALLLLIWIMRLSVGKPLNMLTGSIGRMQAGDFDFETPYQDKGDEIGVVARALETFRGQFIAKEEERRLAEEQRIGFETERSRNAERSAAVAETQARAVDRLATSLAQLADGDFTNHLDDLGPGFEALVADFNRMVDAVSASLAEVRAASQSVDVGSLELATSADTLAGRTEQTAASLEQTAAALHQMAATVRESSGRASEAGSMMVKTRQDAASSANVVRDAIDAMGRIQQSSSKIGHIIGVIDEIAFQTNLLALNAGVEAARAGEAGAGFAVVAQEVRELAQRSANAAKEIKGLINESEREVGAGVDLVNQTGQSLVAIEAQVNDITDRIEAIISGYREQSTGLDEINTAVVSMDQATQQNAAMVEETNAACQELRAQGATLNRIIARFRVRGAATEERRSPRATIHAPAKARGGHAYPVVAGNNALAAAPGDWEEF